VCVCVCESVCVSVCESVRVQSSYHGEHRLGLLQQRLGQQRDVDALGGGDGAPVQVSDDHVQLHTHTHRDTHTHTHTKRSLTGHSSSQAAHTMTSDL